MAKTKLGKNMTVAMEKMKDFQRDTRRELLSIIEELDKPSREKGMTKDRLLTLYKKIK